MSTTDIVGKTATIALYALAALPFIALTAARAEPATIKVSDLNMSRPAHVAEFNRRVDHAADQLCDGAADRKNLSAHAACVAAVRAEAMDGLAARARVASR